MHPGAARYFAEIGLVPRPTTQPDLPMQTKHEIKRCPRCGKAFECKVNNPLPCQCMAVELSSDQLEALQACYEDCLCVDCLREVADTCSG